MSTLKLSLISSLLLTVMAPGAYVIQVDTDGADDGPYTPSPNFSFGGDTDTASSSTDAGTVGTQPGDSIFGGNGINLPDTYLYGYTPAVDGDNTVLASGTVLTDEGGVATGIAAGGSGTYKVWATWPRTNNVSGGDVTYSLSDGISNLFSVQIDQTAENLYSVAAPAEWVLLGQADLDANTTYTLSQVAGSNTFVSMRAFAVMFEPVPEPSAALLGLMALPLFTRRRR